MFVFFFQFYALPQLQATRAVSGRSVPIISFGAGGAAAFMRCFGPESMGGAGDVGAKIDAEVARTGLSDDEIGPKVKFRIMLLGELSDQSLALAFKDILPYRRENHPDSWPSCHV